MLKDVMESDQKLARVTEARAVLTAIESELERKHPGFESARLLQEFIACFNNLPPYGGYKHIPAAAQTLYRSIAERVGPEATRSFLFAALILAITRSLESQVFANLPDRVRHHQLKQFRRIVDNAASITAICDIDNDLFHKDLGLATMRLYAAGAQLVDFRTGIGRVTLVKGGLGEVPRRLALFLKIGGFKPFFQIHTHLAYLDEFNEEGWNECYRCCAELYALHPRVLGMYGGSWFYDPVLSTISPRLNYLRATPQEAGAFCLFDSVSEQTIDDATATSPTRKSMYQEGTYQPKSYSLIWPREAQIRWAASNAQEPVEQ
jgi:hypothetical protein